MKIIALQNIEVIQPNSLEFRAKAIALVKERWWSRNLTPMEIANSSGMEGPWFFMETGKYTPGFEAEELFRAWRAFNWYREES